jgi:imidazolonepropionase-like amidohydrolase
MAKKGVHLTPTLIVCDLLSRPPYNAIIPPGSREKLTHVQEMGFVTLKRAHELGVNIAYGTDAFSSMQPLQLSEFDLRKRVLPSPAILKHATTNAAKVIKMEGKVGIIAKEAFADFLLLSSNPLDDVGIFNKPHEYLQAVVKDGRVVKSSVKSLRVEVPLV